MSPSGGVTGLAGSVTPTCLSSGALVASGHQLAAEGYHTEKQEAPV